MALEDTNNDNDEFADDDKLHLTQAGIDLVERRDMDGEITALREATERYNQGDFVGGDSLVLLVAMYGMVYGNQEMIEAARKAKRFIASDN